jgi:TorA maturation chaperone TorD
LYYLVFNEIEALEEGLMDKARELWKCQSDFFTKHYQTWVFMFCDKITEHTNYDFYKVLAVCFNKFVKSGLTPKFPEEKNIHHLSEL